MILQPIPAQQAAPLSVLQLLGAMRLAVPLAAWAVLALVAQFDARLYDFLAHMVAAVGCFLLLIVVSASYTRGNDGYLRYAGFTLPWVALFELAIAFHVAQPETSAAGAEGLRRASWLLQAGIFALAPFWTARKVRVALATVPWGAASALLFLTALAAPAAEGPAWQGVDLGIAALLAVGIVGVARRRAAFEPRVFALAFGAGAVTFAAFAAFALDRDSLAAREISHVARLIGLWLLYVAGTRSLIAVPSRAEHTYRDLFESSIVGVSLTRHDGTFIAVNPAYAQLFGYESPAAFLAEVPDAAALYEDAAGRSRTLAELAQKGAVRDVEMRMRRRDGEVRWMTGNLVPIRNRDGGILGYQAAVFDITEARAAREQAQRAAAALRESHERFELVARATNDAVWDWNLQSDAMWWSAGYEALFGYRPEETDPSIASWYDHLHPEDLARVRASVRAVIDGGGQAWSDEYRFRRRDGSYAEIFDRGFVVRDAQGQAVRMIGAMMDLSGRKRAERMYAALGALNELVAHAASAEALLQGACEIAAASGNFQVAVVRRVNEARRLAEMAARAGSDPAPYPDRPVDLAPDASDAATLIATAYRTRRPAVQREAGLRGALPFGADPAQVGTRSAGAYPLLHDGRCVGVLALRSRDPEAFEGEMGELLERMAGNVARGLDTLRAAEALRESEERFRSLVALSSDWYWEQDEALRFIARGDAGEQKAHLMPPGYRGKTRWELVGGDLDDPLWAAHKAQLERREPFHDFEYPRMSADGVVRWVSVSGEPMFDAAGRFRGYRGVGRDITARKEVEAERARIARMYASLSALNELVARAQSTDELLLGACEIAVESGNFNYAVVRTVEGDQAAVAALAGRKQLPWFNRPLDLAPGSPDEAALCVTAYRTRRPVVRVDGELTAHPGFERFTAETGARAGAAFPLLHEGACVGMLVLNSPEPQAFDGEVGKLLERLAADVAHGLAALEAREALRRFRLAMDHSADTMALVDRETMCFVDVNASLCRLVGYAAEELVGMRVDRLLTDPLEEIERAYDALIADPGGSATGRGAYRCKDGSVVPFESTRRMLRSGGRWLMIAISRDIRERLAAEEALRRKDAYFRSLIENSSDMFAVVDRDWNYLYASLAVTDILGYLPEEVVGSRFLDRSLPEDAARARGILEALRDWPGASHTLRLRAKRKDGTLRTLEVVVAAGVDEAGEPAYILTGRDITGRIAAEESLARSEQEFRTLVQNSPDVIARWSPDLHCLLISEAIERATGRPAQWFVGRKLDQMEVPGLFAATFAATLRQVLASRAEKVVEFPYPTPQGTRHFEARFMPETGADGTVASVMTISRDVTERVRARQQDAYFRSLIENVSDTIAVLDMDWRYVYVSPSSTALSGYAPEELLGSRFADSTGDDPQAIRRRLAATLERAGGPRQLRFEARRKDGELRMHEVVVSRGTGPDGQPVYVLAARDITDRIRAERVLAESEARLRGIVEATAEPLLVVDPDGITRFANPAAAALFGRSTAELEGAPLGLPLADGRPADVDIVLPGGGIRPAEMQFAATELQGREVLVVSLHDLSERKRYEAHIEHLANHDGLTGLPNRTLLRDRVEQAIVQARRTQRHVGLVFVDLDRFKLINDSFGHGAGDAMLLEVGARLQRTVREGDTVARLGGDEFVILAPGLTQPGDSALVARKVAEALATPVSLEAKELPISASMGIALFPGDGEDLDSLLQCADAAMYRAKDAGRNNYQFYSAEMGEQARNRVETEAGLRQALERGELRLHYQPQVDLTTGQVTGFEALLRWQHPTRGLVSPAAFIPVAEESGLIVPIGHWALREACREAASWAAGGLGSLKMSVNLSARQFWQGSVTEAVRAALAESGLPAAQLEVEITESVVARDLQQVMVSLEQLRRMGVSVAIDDFGTGYSSLAYLRSLPIQKLKIDRSFIKGIPADPEATALVAEIVRLAHVLSLEVVAEGVETQAQAAYLRDSGCEAMQGFLFSRPIPAGDCVGLLRARRRFVFSPDQGTD